MNEGGIFPRANPFSSSHANTATASIKEREREREREKLTPSLQIQTVSPNAPLSTVNPRSNWWRDADGVVRLEIHASSDEECRGHSHPLSQELPLQYVPDARSTDLRSFWMVTILVCNGHKTSPTFATTAVLADSLLIYIRGTIPLFSNKRGTECLAAADLLPQVQTEKDTLSKLAPKSQKERHIDSHTKSNSPHDSIGKSTVVGGGSGSIAEMSK